MNTEQERAELLPCPFCGSTYIEIQTSTPDREGTPTHLMCADCGAAGPWSYESGGSYTVAAAFWNARAALQSQPTESFPCRIIEADLETSTVTLEMQGKYTVSAGQKYLCDAPLQSQDREDAERYRRLRKGDIDDVAVVRGLGAMDYGASAVIATYSEEIDGDDLDAAIDHARRAEGDGK